MAPTFSRFCALSLFHASFASLVAANLPYHPRPVYRRGVTFEREGCFADNAGGEHALAGPSATDGLMTQGKCARFCGADWEYFGLENGIECYCGDSYEGVEQVADDECAVRCGGKHCQTCGGSDRLDVFRNLVYSTPTTTTTTSLVVQVTSSSTAVAEAVTLSTAVAEAVTTSSSVPEVATSSSVPEIVSTSSAPEIVTSSSAPEIVSTSSAPEIVASSSAPEIVSTSSAPEIMTSSSTSDIVTTSSAPEVVTTSAPEAATTSAPEMDATTSSAEAVTTSAPSPTTTDATTCDPAVTYSPATCWAFVPTVCSSLTRTPSIPWPAITPAATACRNAFIAGGTPAAAITSCFTNANSPAFSAASAYSCVKNAPSIYCTYSTLPCDAAIPAPTAIPVNGNFESGDMSSWTLSSSSLADDVFSAVVSNENPHGGSGYSLKAVFSNTNGGSRMWTQTVALEPGASYVASWWWYSTNSAASTVSRLQLANAGMALLTDAPTLNQPTGQWIKTTSAQFTAGATFITAYLSMYGNKANAGNTFYMDDLSFTKVS